MPKLAAKTSLLKQSGIRSITHLINEVDGVNLGQGICDMPIPDPIKNGAIDAIHADKSVYTSYAGISELRNSIFDKARNFNKLPISSPEEIVVSGGATGAFVCAIFATLEAGDEVILFEPFYGYHKNLLELLEVDIRYVRLHGPNFDVDFDEFRNAMSSKTKAIILNTPSNPCGKVWNRKELEKVVELADEFDSYIITDEMYEYMIYDDHQHISPATIPGAWDRTITISGFSKTYNMTGWRLGYTIAPQEISDKMGLLNDLFFVCAPSPLQYGVNAAFSMPDSYYSDLQAAYDLKREMICQALSTVGFDAPKPQGSYYVLANFENLSEEREGFGNDQEACETLIYKAGVGTIPGKSFFNDPEDGRFYLRFCYAKEVDVLQDACDRILKAFG